MAQDKDLRGQTKWEIGVEVKQNGGDILEGNGQLREPQLGDLPMETAAVSPD